MRFARRGGKSAVIRPEEEAAKLAEFPALPNNALLTALARALYWQKLLDEGLVQSGSDIARKEGLDVSTVNELLRLTLLDPYIVDDIMAGRQPPELTAHWFCSHPLPVNWHEQQMLVAQVGPRW
jgi:hypothetical protein